MPTVAELNAAAPDTPVLVLFLYSQGLLNRAGVEALGLTAGSRPPEGGRYEFVDKGGTILHAEPSPAILYTTIARLPQLSPEDQVNSTRHFFRELNRFGLTSVVDPGGGGHAYPSDYKATERSQEKLISRFACRNTCSRRRGDGEARVRDVDSPGETQPQQGDRPSRRLRARGGGREPRLVGGRFRRISSRHGPNWRRGWSKSSGR